MDLIVDCKNGVYAPKYFIEIIIKNDPDHYGINFDDYEAVKNGPDDEYYWDAWTNIVDDFNYNGQVIHEIDGDIFLGPPDFDPTYEYEYDPDR